MIDSLQISMIIITGIGAGFIDAIAGGGGLLTIPALLGIGLPAHIALGTNKLAASFGSSTATLTFYLQKFFTPRLWWRGCICTALAACAGVFAVDAVPKQWLEKWLPALIIALAMYTIINHRRPSSHYTKLHPAGNWRKKQMIQGLILGFYDGFIGPGTGAFWLASSLSLYRLKILLCAGLSKAMTFTSNAVSLVTFIYLGQVNWIIGILLGVSIMIGAFLGARSAIRFGEAFIRPIFLGVVIILAGKLVWQAW